MADSRIETLLKNWAGEDNPILPPISNNERILQNILGVEGVEILPIQSRNEALLLQILEQGGGSGGGSVSGLDFEAGIFIPEEDVSCTWINFSKTHDSLPMYICIQDANGDWVNEGNSYLFQDLCLYPAFSGQPIYTTGESNTKYGITHNQELSSNGGSVLSASTELTWPLNNDNDSTRFYARYWTTESKFKIGQDAVTTLFWRAGRTYKWIAVWPPAAE